MIASEDSARKKKQRADRIVRLRRRQEKPRRISLALRTHRLVKELEPWGILLAVVGLGVSITVVMLDMEERRHERDERQRARVVDAWQLLTTEAPGNSGKIQALETLIQAGQPLNGIDLSVPKGLPGAHLERANLAGAILHQANLTDVDLGNANLAGANLIGANLTDANLKSADFYHSSLARANLTNANFTDAFLRNANLTHANLTGASLFRATLTHASLMQADLTGANLSRSNISSSQLDTACGDEKTILPSANPTIPMCNEVEWYEEVHGNRYAQETIQ